MSGDRYKIQDQFATYYLTLTIVKWIDIFSRIEYRDTVVESLNYCINNKGLILNSWVIMTNHIHLVCRVESEIGMSGFLRDFKKFTSKKIAEQVEELNESRKEWLLDKFGFEAKRTGRAEVYKIWKDGNHPIDLSNHSIDIMNKIDYVHMNPVKAGWVDFPEDYIYSSARNYVNRKGLIKVEII